MANAKAEETWDPWERVVAALLGTVALSYLIFLALDLLNGWGMGWVVLSWAALGILVLLSVLGIVALWTWVWRNTGRQRMGK